MSDIKDRVAVVGVGSTAYSRDSGRTSAALVLEACVAAIRDSGLSKDDIDGVCGSNRVELAQYVQHALGLPSVSWWVNTVVPFQHQLIEAMNAVHAGSCTAALIYHGNYRASGVSRSAGSNPLRVRYGAGFNVPAADPDTFKSPVGYAPWAGRYLRDHGLGREVFGKVAINSRSNAVLNDHAAMRSPLTMDEYMSARMVRSPLTMYDMDYPVDGADAFVITSVERARDLAHGPVLIHAAVMGQSAYSVEDQLPDMSSTGQQVVARELARRSDIGIGDIDLFFPYDGFTVITARWFEVLGFCGDGEANDFFDQHWDGATNRLLLDGRVPVNAHGGSLSDGGVQGSNHFREAVVQMRGDAGARQVEDASAALLTIGGMFFNAGGVVVRRE